MSRNRVDYRTLRIIFLEMHMVFTFGLEIQNGDGKPFSIRNAPPYVC
jgi:hypothetical protein